MAFRFLADRAFARALPPLAAPKRERACACGFFPSAGFRASPVASSTTRSAFWAKSARLPPLLARVGMSASCHIPFRRRRGAQRQATVETASGERPRPSQAKCAVLDVEELAASRAAAKAGEASCAKERHHPRQR